MAQDIPFAERLRRFEAGQGEQPPNPNERAQVPPVGPGALSTQDRGLVDPSIFGTLADKSLNMDPRFWNEGGGFGGYQIPWFMVKGKKPGESKIPEFIRKRLFQNLGWKGKAAGLLLPTALHGIESIVQDNPAGKFGVHESNPEEASRRRDLAFESAAWEAAGGAIGSMADVGRYGREVFRNRRGLNRVTEELGGPGGAIYGDIAQQGAAGTKATPPPKPPPKPKSRQKGGPDATPRAPRLDRMVGKPEAPKNVADFFKQVIERDLPLGGTSQAGRRLATIVQNSSDKQIRSLLGQARANSPEFYTRIYDAVQRIGIRNNKAWAKAMKDNKPS